MRLTKIRPIAVHELLAASVLTCAVALTGCSSPSVVQGSAKPADTSTGAAAATGCAKVSVPMTTIDSHAPAEPRLAIPQPPGWERITKLDSELIRFVVANKALTADSFSPNVVVTLEHVAGTQASPDNVLEQELNGVESLAGGTDLKVESTERICGSTAKTVSYLAPAQGAVPARPAKVLVVAAQYGGDTWAAAVTAQAVNGDDPTYQQDSSTILAGFQMLAPP